jgi:hypothetical protein
VLNLYYIYHLLILLFPKEPLDQLKHEEIRFPLLFLWHGLHVKWALFMEFPLAVFLKLFSACSEYFCKKNGADVIVIGAAPALSLILINRHG